MEGMERRFTSDRRTVDTVSWKDDADWHAGAPENVDVIDNSIIPQRFQLPGGDYGGQVFLTRDWDTGKKPETAGNLVDGDKNTGLVDGKIHDDNIWGVSGQILVKFNEPINWSAIAYHLRIRQGGNSWNQYNHSLKVSDGSEWKTINSWSDRIDFSRYNGDITEIETKDLPLENIDRVALNLWISQGADRYKEIWTEIQYFNFLLVE